MLSIPSSPKIRSSLPLPRMMSLRPLPWIRSRPLPPRIVSAALATGLAVVRVRALRARPVALNRVVARAAVDPVVGTEPGDVVVALQAVDEHHHGARRAARVRLGMGGFRWTSGVGSGYFMLQSGLILTGWKPEQLMGQLGAAAANPSEPYRAHQYRALLILILAQIAALGRPEAPHRKYVLDALLRLSRQGWLAGTASGSAVRSLAMHSPATRPRSGVEPGRAASGRRTPARADGPWRRGARVTPRRSTVSGARRAIASWSTPGWAVTITARSTSSRAVSRSTVESPKSGRVGTNGSW